MAISALPVGSAELSGRDGSPSRPSGGGPAGVPHCGGLGETALPAQHAGIGRDGSPSRPSCGGNAGVAQCSGLGETALPAQRAAPGIGRDGSPSRPSCGGKVLSLPCRKRLPHDIPIAVPSWVTDNAVFFITINTLPRGENQLACKTVHDVVVESVLHRQNMGQMWALFILLMPDHLHGLFVFSAEVSMRKAISDWKRFLATQCGIKWQRDYFDHRIRQEESASEKWDYIRMNPVRKGLALQPDDWPFQWQNGGLGETALPAQRAAPGIGRDGSPSRPSCGGNAGVAQNGGLGETALPAQHAGIGRDGSPSRPSGGGRQRDGGVKAWVTGF